MSNFLPERANCILSFRAKGSKFIPYFKPEWLKNHTFSIAPTYTA